MPALRLNKRKDRVGPTAATPNRRAKILPDSTTPVKPVKTHGFRRQRHQAPNAMQQTIAVGNGREEMMMP